MTSISEVDFTRVISMITADVHPMIITEFFRALLQADAALYSIFIPTLAQETGVRLSTVYAWFNGNGDLPLKHLTTSIRIAARLGYDLAPLRDLLAALFDKPPDKPLPELKREALILLGRVEEQNITTESDMNSRDSAAMMELARRFLDLGRGMQGAMIRRMVNNSKQKGR